MISHLYLSPHLDDVVISCGGLIAQQTANGELVSVVTVCAGNPPPGRLSSFARQHHQRWGEADSPLAIRRAEDRIACGRLDASVVHLDIPDAVYRLGRRGKALYLSNEAIYGPLHVEDESLLDRVVALLEEVCPPESKLYSPMAFGGHVDHRLTRLAAERLGLTLWYYRDLPYAARDECLPADLGQPAGVETIWPLSPGEIDAWASAIAMYRSQLSGLWSDVQSMHRELRDYHDALDGIWILAPKVT